MNYQIIEENSTNDKPQTVGEFVEKLLKLPQNMPIVRTGGGDFIGLVDIQICKYTIAPNFKYDYSSYEGQYLTDGYTGYDKAKEFEAIVLEGK
jgi:hypothetical protein